MKDQSEASAGLQPLELRPPKEAWQVAWAKAQSQGLEDASIAARELRPQGSFQAGGTACEAAQATISPQEGALNGGTGLQQQGTHPGIAPTFSGLPSSRQPPAPWPLHVLRSSQLDAGRLDVELLALLREQLQKALSLFQPGRVADWEPELNALLRLLVFGLSVLRGNATPGSQLLNLRYRSESPFHPSNHTINTQASQLHAPPAPPPTTPSPADSSVVGRTGVEGSGLSLAQRLGLGFGMVLVPYVWSRAASYLARAAGSGAPVTWADLQSDTASSSSSSHDNGWQDGSFQSDPGAAESAPGGEETDASVSDGAAPKPRPGGGLLRLAYVLLLRGPHRLAQRLVAGLLLLLRKAGAVLGLSSAGQRGGLRRGLSRVATWSDLPPHELLWKCMQVSEAAYHVATLINFLHFLAGGRYRSVLERVLGARLVYYQPVMTRIISFEYLNRQLVWQEVSELLLFVLPMLDALRTRNTLRRWLPHLPDPRRLLNFQRDASLGPGSQPSETAADAHKGGDAGEGEGESMGSMPAARKHTASAPKGPMHRPKAPCPVCGNDDMLTPVVAVPCGHCFCYYCLASNTAASQHYECPCDGVRVAAMERWKPGYPVST